MGFLKWIAGIIIVFWLLGFIFEVGGGIIHILLVVAVVLFLVDFITGRNRTN